MRPLARLLPPPIRSRLRELQLRAHTQQARRRWDNAIPARAPLDAAVLDQLVLRYPPTATDYRYGAEDLRARGTERRTILEAALEGAAPHAGASLELGSADAMSAAALAAAGWRATAIDIDTSRTDPRAHAAGVQVIEMDATRLTFPDETFDLVYSFNVFEHLPNPDATFAEMIRVLRPGGIAYLSFAALRFSPHGAHMYKVIGVPYVTVLFDEADVLRYLRAHNLTDRFPTGNDYSVERFRTLFQAHTDTLDTLCYQETRNRWHVRLISEYPDVFKARAPSFDSLLVDSIRASFRRRVPQ